MNKKVYIIIIAVLAAILSVSTFILVRNYFDAAKQTEQYQELAGVVEQNDAEETTEPAADNATILPEYAEPYEQNKDMVGWVRIDGTKLNYPVMQSVDEPNFYLKHGFDKKYTDYGCPYVQENCDVLAPSDNIVLYGHHMSDGSMFAVLDKYKKEAFWKEHKTIQFDTLTKRNKYEIIAAFKTVVYTDSPESFKYYHFTDAENREEFDEYIAKCKELSFYDTGVTAEYGDKLITLSTCEYSRNNGRIVVVAKLIN